MIRNASVNELILKGVDKLEENGHPYLAGGVVGLMDYFSALGVIGWTFIVAKGITKTITKKKA